MTKEEIMSRKKPFAVRGVGFGFLAVKQGIFEKIKRPWFSQTEVEVINEETGAVEYKFPLMGEDLSWCEKVHRMGVTIWVDPLVRVNHHKQVKIEWPK
jgi:GT2 family glycosyltransferase